MWLHSLRGDIEQTSQRQKRCRGWHSGAFRAGHLSFWWQTSPPSWVQCSHAAKKRQAGEAMGHPELSQQSLHPTLSLYQVNRQLGSFRGLVARSTY